MDLGFLGELASGGATGGVVGIFGSLASKCVSIFTASRDHKYKMEESQLAFSQKKEFLLETSKLAIQKSEQEIEGKINLAKTETSLKNLGKHTVAVANQKNNYHYHFVNDFVCGTKELFRPFLTAGLFILVWIFYNTLIDLVSGEVSQLSGVINNELAKDIILYIVNSVVFTACTAGTWWFCDRALAPPKYKR